MEKTALIFESPLWFAALALLPVVAALFAWSQWRSGRLLERVISPRLREQLAGAVSRPLRALRAVLVLAALAAIIVALARPQKGYVEREIAQRGRDVILAVDTSRSMLATDMAPTRLARAKLFAKDLLQLAEGDRVGVVAFAGSAFLQAPLTLDRAASLAAIDELDTSIIPKGGTNIAEAIRVAARAFGKGEGHSRALIIVTDGEELDADGIAAARQAGAEGIRIFTVGVGSPEGSLIPIRTDEGRPDFVRDLAGKPVQSRLDATRLREIAEAGGGFFEMLTANTAATIFEKGIIPLDAVERDTMAARQPIERYQWPLGAGILFLVLWLLLGERKMRAHRPRTAALLLLVLTLPALSARAADGLEAYEKGDYPRSLQEFQSRLKNSPHSSKLQFNAGAAAFKAGDYHQAVDWFSKALASDQGDSDAAFRDSAAYNLANALTRRGESSEKNEEKKADWNSAISHYESVLKDQPDNTAAKENQEIVKKLLEDLKKQEEQQNKDQQNKDQQNKDQQNKDQQDKDQQNKDQQDKDQQDKDQQNKDQQGKDQQGKDQQGKDQQGKDQQNKDQQGKDQQDKDQQNKDQQNKDQQNKDQQNKDQQNKDQQGKDQQDKDQQNKDQQNKDQQGKDQQDKDQQGKDQQDKDQQSKDQQDKDQQDKDQQSKDQQSPPRQNPSSPGDREPPREMPEPTPGEKKEGDIKPLNESEEGETPVPMEPEEKDGEMSEAQARALLNSLRGDEERVRVMRPAQEQTLKDW